MEIVIIALLAILVIGAVAVPLFRGGRGHRADAQEFALGPAPAATVNGAGTAAAPAAAELPLTAAGTADALEAEVARYRSALVANTLCRRCGEANSPEARFCQECGKALPASDAQEFAT